MESPHIQNILMETAWPCLLNDMESDCNKLPQKQHFANKSVAKNENNFRRAPSLHRYIWSPSVASVEIWNFWGRRGWEEEDSKDSEVACGGWTGELNGRDVRDLGVDVAMGIGVGCALDDEREEELWFPTDGELRLDLVKLARVSIRCCIFSSKANNIASNKSAFWVLEVALLKFRALLAILMRSFIAKYLLSCSRGSSTLNENWRRPSVERLFLSTDWLFSSAMKKESNTIIRSWALQALLNNDHYKRCQSAARFIETVAQQHRNFRVIAKFAMFCSSLSRIILLTAHFVYLKTAS